LSKHKDLLARHQAVLPAWMALYYEEPIALVRGDGRRVWDAEGKEYLDFFAGILTNMLGYNLPEVTEAIQSQAAKILHSSTLYLIEAQIELAEKLTALSGIPDSKVFFTNSGTEANDAAMMMATLHRGSNQILAIRNSYHGRSFAAVSLTGNRSWSPTSLSPLAVTYIHGGYKLRSPFGHMPDAEFIAACVQDLRDMLDIATAGDVAAMIAEPIQGVGGFVTPPDGFFGAFKEVLDEHGILYISDEVQTGWGRTGENFWGYQAHGLTPDVITFAKGIANGMAMGGVIGRADIVDAIKANSISTFGGNPMSTAAALATIDYVERHDVQTNASKVGNRLRTGLDHLAETHAIVGEVRGKGLMVGVELVEPGSIDPNAAAASAILESARERGLLIGKGGLYGNALRIAPPLTLTEEEADEGLAILTDAIAEAEAAGSS
jgi:4-aminobutyrate aminotransferase